MPEDSVVISLLARGLKRRELTKHKAVLKTFGMDYEEEKAKQEAIWEEWQRKKNRGGRGPKNGFILKFLADVKRLDTQLAREKAIENLEMLAKKAHTKAIGDAKGCVKWARIEAYVYQVINTLMRTYDQADIKRRLDELKRMIENELGKKGRKA